MDWLGRSLALSVSRDFSAAFVATGPATRLHSQRPLCYVSRCAGRECAALTARRAFVAARSSSKEHARADQG